jgi:hypothetical protein
MKEVFYETQSKYTTAECQKILKSNQWFPVYGPRTTKVREVVKVQAETDV